MIDVFFWGKLMCPFTVLDKYTCEVIIPERKEERIENIETEGLMCLQIYT